MINTIHQRSSMGLLTLCQAQYFKQYYEHDREVILAHLVAGSLFVAAVRETFI